MNYETAIEASNLLYKIESLDDLNNELKRIRVDLEDPDEVNIILDAIEKINAKQDELRRKINEL